MEYFHVTKEEIKKKLFNVFVGISLGNRLLTPELAEKYVKWDHTNTKDKAVILFYEPNSARFCKELFIDQFEFAVNNYFEA